MTELQLAFQPSAEIGHCALLVPVPPDTWHQRFEDFAVTGARWIEALTAQRSEQQALWLMPEGRDPIVVRFGFGEGVGQAPAWFWDLPATRVTTPSPELSRLAQEIAGNTPDTDAAVEALVAEAEQRFRYDHPAPEEKFNYGHDSIPVLACGLTPGSCVDINTWLIGALRAIGVEVAYLAGHVFPHGQSEIDTGGHCWLATRVSGEVRFWDVAHHLRFGLGPTRPALDPVPGRRVTLSAGRCLAFALDDGSAAFLDHFYDAYWITESGPVRAQCRSRLRET